MSLDLKSTLILTLYRSCFLLSFLTLTNVVRHANASRVKVNLKKDGNAVVLTVQDNGIGMDLKKLTDTQSLGLIGMRERVYPFGGQVRIDGVPGTGTTVRVSIPLEKSSDGSQE